MASITIEAYGVPKTQGSARAFVKGGRAVVTTDNKELRPWRDTVAYAALDALGSTPEWTRPIGPVAVSIWFWMPRPSSKPRTRDVIPSNGLDTDKLVRAVLDSLTNAGVWGDDAQVADLHAFKRYVVGPDLPKIYIPARHRTAPGAHIVVRDLGQWF